MEIRPCGATYARLPSKILGMAHLITLIEHYGLAQAFVNVLLMHAGLPVPGYSTLIGTGARAGPPSASSA